MFFAKGEINMNNIYKVIWSKAKNCYVVASEIARSHTKSATGSGKIGGVTRRSLLASLMALSLLCGGLGVASAADSVKVDVSTTSTTEVYTTTGVDTLLADYGRKTEVETNKNNIVNLQTTTTDQGQKIATNTADIANNKTAIDKKIDTVTADARYAAKADLIAKADATALDDKADKTAVAALEGRVSGVEGKVAALEGKVGDASSGLVKDVATLKTTVGDASSGLVKDVTALETTVGDASSGLVKDVTALETTVGDASSGLVKDVNDLRNQGNTLNTALGSKADKSELDAAKEKITTNETNITALQKKTTGLSDDGKSLTSMNSVETDALTVKGEIKNGAGVTTTLTDIKASMDKANANETAIGQLQTTTTDQQTAIDKLEEKTADISHMAGGGTNISGVTIKDGNILGNGNSAITGLTNVETGSIKTDSINGKSLTGTNVATEKNVADAVKTETDARIAADNALEGKINDEKTAREAADAKINTKIGNINDTRTVYVKDANSISQNLTTLDEKLQNTNDRTGGIKRNTEDTQTTIENKVTVNGSGDVDGVKGLSAETINTTGDAGIGGKLNVTGASDLKGDVTLGTPNGTNTVTVNGTADFNAAVKMNNGLNVINGETNLKDTTVDGDLKVTGTITTDKMVFGDPATNNYTEIDHGKVTSKNLVVNGAGQTISSSSTFDVEKNEVGFTNTATGDHSYYKQTAKGINGYVTDKDGNKTYTKVTATENSFQVQDKDGKNKNHQVNTKDSSVTEITNGDGKTTKTEQTATDITNTAKDGTITNDGKNIVNVASENISNKSQTMDTTVTGKATESYGELDTTVNGKETHKVTGDQENTIGGNQTTTVEGNVKEDYKKDLTTTVGGNELHEVTGTKTENVTGKVTENYKAGQETNVTGDQDIYVTGKQTNTVESGQENIISGGQTNTITGGQINNITGDQTTTVTDGNISNTAKNITNAATETLTDKVGTNTRVTTSTSITDTVGTANRKIEDGKIIDTAGDSTVTTEKGKGTTFAKTTSAAYSTKAGAPMDTNIAGNHITTGRVDANELGVSDEDGANTADFSVKAGEGVKASAGDGNTKGSLDVTAEEVGSTVKDASGKGSTFKQRIDAIMGNVKTDAGESEVTQKGDEITSKVGLGEATNSRVTQKKDMIESAVTDGTNTNDRVDTASASAKKLTDGTRVNKLQDNLDSSEKTITNGTYTTSKVQTALDITNTAKDGTITNDAKNIVNNATGDMTNTVGGKLTTTVTGQATENFKGGLKTDITGEEIHTVTGNQTNKVTGKQTNTVEGGQENIISGGQINNITGDQTTTISGTQTTTATDIKRNASSGMIDTIDNDYGTNTETKVAGKTTTDVSIKGTGEKGQYIRGANESRDYLIKGTLKNSETKTVEKTSTEITDGTNKASTIQDAKNLAGSVTNGTETGVSGIHANDDGSVSIDSGVTDGTNTSVQKQTASAIATDVKDGAGNENASVATATTSANTIKSGSKANTVISTADGTSFINSEAAAPVTGASGAGTAVNTTIKGNTITTGKVTMDYAEVMKDLGVHGNAKVDQNLEVGGTSTLKGDVTMESNATVKKDLKVEGTTTTQTLKVTENAEIDGTLKVAKKATFEDSVSIAKDLSVGGDVTANSYKVGDKTYIDANGIHANGQKITDVADGSISEGSKDAVNGGQLYGVKRDLEHQVDKVGANAAAMANLRPMEFDPSSKWNIAAAIGNYGSETAAALGAFYRPNDDVMVNLSTAFGTGENMVGGGVSVRLGKSGNKLSREENNALKAQVDDLTARMDALLSVLNPNMSKDFPDVPENHWAYEAVSRLAGNDIVQGYPDGEFHGERTMTRYEMAEIIYNALSRGAEAERELVEEFKPELQAMAASEKATAEKAEG